MKSCTHCGSSLHMMDQVCPVCSYKCPEQTQQVVPLPTAYQHSSNRASAPLQPAKKSSAFSWHHVGLCVTGIALLLFVAAVCITYWDSVATILKVILAIAAFCVFVGLMTWAMIGDQHPPRKIRKTILDARGNVVGYIEEDAPVERTAFFIWWH